SESDGRLWYFQIYGQENCGKGNHYQVFYGSTATVFCSCYNVAASMNDNFHSFVWTKNKPWNGDIAVNMYEHADCKGDVLGAFRDNIIRKTVSQRGSKMSSFSICKYLFDAGAVPNLVDSNFVRKLGVPMEPSNA
ncbi:hypothetical protein HK099_001026, partial [Clydaea vesicula]